MSEKFFVDGCLVRVDLQVDNNGVLVSIVHDYTSEQRRGQFLARVDKLEKPCHTVFQLGDRVRSTLREENQLVGNVVGYEYAENRVICVSDKIERYRDRRVRYSYALNELEPHDPNLFDLEDGKRYLINHIIPVRAVKGYPCVYELVADNGSVVAVNVSETTYRSDLALKYGIFTIKPI